MEQEVAMAHFKKLTSSPVCEVWRLLFHNQSWYIEIILKRMRNTQCVHRSVFYNINKCIEVMNCAFRIVMFAHQTDIGPPWE